jgi:hypothetical protein
MNKRKKFAAADQEKLVEQVGFWIFKTLEGWYRGVKPVSALDEEFTTYYPCKLKHKKRFGFEAGTFYIKIAKDVWTRMWRGEMVYNVN